MTSRWYLVCASGFDMTSTPDSIESTIIVVVHWLKLGVEIFGAGLVTLGVCVAIVHLIRTLAARKPSEFTTPGSSSRGIWRWPWSSNLGQTFSAQRFRRVGTRSASSARSR